MNHINCGASMDAISNPATTTDFMGGIFHDAGNIRGTLDDAVGGRSADASAALQPRQQYDIVGFNATLYFVDNLPVRRPKQQRRSTEGQRLVNHVKGMSHRLSSLTAKEKYM